MKIDEMIKEFRRPFSSTSVKYKIQTVGQKACLCVAYVDARLVQERLNNITGGTWSNTNREIFGPDSDGKMGILAVEATISVYIEESIISHSDVGSLDNVNEDQHGLKALYSDAFKRAAVHFGIAQSLYSLPVMFLSKNTSEVREKEGKVVGISREGEDILKIKYQTELKRLIKEFGPVYDN